MNKDEKKTTMPGRVIEGVVKSVKTPKTVIVAVQSSFRHPLYKKAVRRTRRFAAHNESFELAVGDTVRMRETKPISRTKHFIVFEKVSK